MTQHVTLIHTTSNREVVRFKKKNSFWLVRLFKGINQGIN